MAPKPKDNIAAIEPAVHGGIDYQEMARLGIEPGALLDFSVSTNPCGPPAGVMPALARADVERYPDSQSLELRRALASQLAVGEENVLVAGGSTELIRLAALAYLGAGDTALIPQPTYSDYEIACLLCGARVVKAPRAGGRDVRLKVGDIISAIQKERPGAVFICNPNNPTGQYLARRDVEAILDAAPEALVVLDEAYVAFAGRRWRSEALLARDNLLILRSMTKDYALAGLRLGYALAGRRIVSVLRRVQPPWSVNAVAQQAGLAVLKEEGYPESCRREVARARAYLVRELRDLGLRPVPSAANYFLVRTGKAARFRQDLLAIGILVRDCTSFGLPDHIRLGVRPMPECRRLVQAIKSIKAAPA